MMRYTAVTTDNDTTAYQPSPTLPAIDPYELLFAPQALTILTYLDQFGSCPPSVIPRGNQAVASRMLDYLFVFGFISIEKGKRSSVVSLTPQGQKVVYALNHARNTMCREASKNALWDGRWRRLPESEDEE